MKVISKKDGELLSQFDNVNQTDIPILSRFTDLPSQIRSTPHQKMFICKPFDANKRKLKGYLFLEDLFCFCKSFKKVTKKIRLSTDVKKMT